MPMIDLTYPQGALEPDALAEAIEKMTDTFLRVEGAPVNDATRAMSWTIVNEMPPGAINVGGRPAEQPVYRLLLTAPEGTLLSGPGPFAKQSRAQLVREITEIVLAAEGTEYSSGDAGRVMVLIREIEDGRWGGMGTIFTMSDIIAFASPDVPQTDISAEAREALARMLPALAGSDGAGAGQ
ncbi:MAG TPA: hypothetical protein VF715_14370 [Thermoleophilaceae bacterium]